MSFILRRLGFYLVAFFASLTINFFLPRLIPGDPADAILGRPGSTLSVEQIASIRAALGISDAPLGQQYLDYLAQLASGDLGVSFLYYPTPVVSLISNGFGWTILLSVTALIVSFILGHLLGIFSAWRRGTFLSNALPPTLIFIGAFPAFFLAIAFVWYFGYQLDWFPASHAYDRTLTPGFNLDFILSVGYHMLLPLIVLVLTTLGGWAIGMRNVMISVLGEDYITLAEAKGLSSNRVRYSYAARNAMLPSVTAFGIILGASISGQLLIEQVFSYPGVGFLLVNAVNNKTLSLDAGIVFAYYHLCTRCKLHRRYYLHAA